MSDRITTTKFGEWLTSKFLDWERKEGKKKTITAFAKYLSVPQSSLSSWMTGCYLPSNEAIGILARHLGIDVYQVLGIEAPNARLMYLESIWPTLDDDCQKQLFELAQQLVRDEHYCSQ